MPFIDLGGRYRRLKKFYCRFHQNFENIFRVIYRDPNDYDCFVDEFSCNCPVNECFPSLEAVIEHCGERDDWYHQMYQTYVGLLHFNNRGPRLSTLYFQDSDPDEENNNNNGEGVERARNVSDR